MAEQQLNFCRLATVNGEPVDELQQRYKAAMQTLAQVAKLLNVDNLNHTLNQLAGLGNMMAHMQNRTETIVELVHQSKR